MKLLSVFAYARLLTVAGVLGMAVASPIEAQTIDRKSERGKAADLFLKDLPSNGGTASDALANPLGHIAQSVTRVLGVELNQTNEGLEIILKTPAGGERLVPLILPEGNNIVIDILDATLGFSIRNGVRETNPAPGISSIALNKVNENSIRLTITGENQALDAEVVPGSNDVVISVVPEAATAEVEPDEEIEVIATGEAEDDGYVVEDANVGTRTDTPVKDIPQSIQVIPQEVIKDQRATSVIETIRNSSGVVPGADSPRDPFENFDIRGFDASENTLTNGLQDPTNGRAIVTNNIERIEILKGPASVLFGQGTVGGTVNYVTKQPLDEPFYWVEFSAGNYNLYSGALDFSAPLNEEKSVAYRLNGVVRTSESFVDSYDKQEYQIAPVLTWEISDRTKVTFEADYSQVNTPFDAGLPVVGTIEPNPNGEIPRDRFVGEPDNDDSQNSVFRIGYDLEHEFNDDWRFKSVFRTATVDLDRGIVLSFLGFEDEDLTTLSRSFSVQEFNENVYNLDNYVVGEFATGSIEHKLVAGINLFRQDTDLTDKSAPFTSLDVFNPVYGGSTTGDFALGFDIESQIQSLGLFVQDQINITDKFIVLLGGRFDIASQDFENAAQDVDDFSQEEAFSPRAGIVYKPIEPISVYASYTRSFQQATSIFSRAPVDPERGTQYEIGVKGDISDRLSATLALYHLTLTNLPVSDPNNPFVTVPTGEQRSKGIELDVSGEIMPGWNVIAGYAYTDAEITEDNTEIEGNKLSNIPENSINFWTTYKIGQGSLSGLGFGLGFFILGDRPGDAANTFELPGYTRTDAAIFYERDKFRTALNFKNLFDNDYFVSSQSRNSVFPSDPFTVIGSMSYEF